MPRKFSNTGIASMLKHETTQVWLVLLELTLEDGSVFRVVNNNELIKHRDPKDGQVHDYEPYAFDLILPGDEKEKLPTAQLAIDNVSLELIDELRQQTSPIKVTIKIIRAAAPNTIEMTVPGMELYNVSWDAQQITGTLAVEDILNLTYPNNFNLFDPIQFKGLFFG